MVDDAMIGRAHRALETVHAMVYFAPEADQEFTAIGLRPGRMNYFASRSAPMGPVGPEVVTATFYNFNPDLVARHIPRAWTLAEPAQVLAARVRVADLALRRLLGRGGAAAPDVAELAGLARTACAGCRLEGRPLYAGHAGLPWPDEPHLVLWHAASLLREHRGDGHIAALLAAGLTGIEALVTHTATGRGFLGPAARTLRFWSDEQWGSALDRLRARGLVNAHGTLTPAGVELRMAVERDTDRMDSGPWAALGEDGTRRLIELGKGVSRRLQAAGAFPPGVFAA